MFSQFTYKMHSKISFHYEQWIYLDVIISITYSKLFKDARTNIFHNRMPYFTYWLPFIVAISFLQLFYGLNDHLEIT